MRKMIAVVMVVLLFMASAFSLTSCWIGNDHTPKPGAGDVVTESPTPFTDSSEDTSSDEGAAQPSAPADTTDDDDESDIFGD